MAVWSKVKLSNLGHASRIEAEYYRPEYMEIQNKLTIASAMPLTRYLLYLTDGTHITPKYVINGIPFLSSSDVDPFLLPFKFDKFISKEEHNRLKHCQPSAGDILMSKSGRIGSCAVVPKEIKKGDCNIYEGIALLRIAGIDPYYTVAFLNSKYGYYQIRRELKGVAQPHLHLEDIRRLNVFIPESSIISKVREIVIKGTKIAKQSYMLYQKAQLLLESELGLDKLNFKKPVGYTARFSELEQSRRLDAHHFQPRFEQVINHLAGFASERVRDIRTYNRRGIQPIYVEDGPVAVVNSQHIGPQHIDYEGLQKTSEKDFASSPEGHIQKNDLLIYTTGAYIGRTNVWLGNKPALASNHVNILRLNSGIDAAYMALVFQSVIGQFQTQKHARGSAQSELYPADIDRFIVPLLAPSKQTAIGNLVRDSLEKQQESKQLLEQAKNRVEQLIEEATS